jgi:hypothetical protein
MGQVRQLVKQFDKDGDGRLNREERRAAREFLKKERAARGPGGFRPGGPGGFGPGGPGGAGPRPSGVDLDPLVGLNDTRKPLRSRLLAVPALRDRYLEHVRAIAEVQLDWKKLGPAVARYSKLIEKEVEADTRKLYPLAAFRSAVADAAEDEAGPGRGREMGLRAFAQGRRSYLLEHPQIKALVGKKSDKEEGK